MHPHHTDGRVPVAKGESTLASTTDSCDPRCVIEPLSRPRPPLVRGVSGTPVAYTYRDVVAEILYNGAWAPGQIAGGLLVGAHFQCPDTGKAYVEVEGFVGGTHCESLGELLRNFRIQWKTAGLALRYNFPGSELVGWYAAFPTPPAPPGQEALLLHQTFFTHPWQIGLWLAPDAEGPVALVAGSGESAAGPLLVSQPVGLIQTGRAR